MIDKHKEKRIFRDSKHNRDMLADANYTILKIEHFQMQQQTKRESAFKKKMSNSVKSIFRERRYGKIHKTLEIIENKKEKCNKYFEKAFQNRLKTKKDLQMSRLNSRIEQLKKRILPSCSQDGKNIESKLKEIIDINNNNQSQNNIQNVHYYSQKNSPTQKYRNKICQQQADYKQIQRNLWKKLSEEIKLKSSTVDLIRSNRINMLMRKTIDSEEDLQAFNKIQSLLHKKNQSSLNTSQTSSFIRKTADLEFKLRLSTKVNSSFTLQTENYKRISQSNKNNELAEWQMIRYLKQKEKRKKFVNSISKELVQNEEAVKIYSLVKGGYSIDHSEVEGEFISLRRFNEARSEFATLNELYNTVKQDISFKSNIDEQILKQNMIPSFRRLVQINELSQKIPNNQLKKLMKTSKVVV